MSSCFSFGQGDAKVRTQNGRIVGSIVRPTTVVFMRLQDWNGEVSSLGSDMCHQQSSQRECKNAHAAAGEMHGCGFARELSNKAGRRDVVEIERPKWDMSFWDRSLRWRSECLPSKTGHE